MAKQQAQRPQQPLQAKKPAPAAPRRSEKKPSIFSSADNHELIFGRKNFIYFGIGLVLVLAGLAIMAGGAMPDPNKWEPERIYSFQRITLAPILMVAGFVVVIYGIFTKDKSADTTGNSDLYA